MRKTHWMWRFAALVFVAGLALVASPASTQTTIPPECVVPANTMGTVTLPPAGCKYLSPDQVHLIIDGLPPDTVIVLDTIHQDFICRTGGGLPCNQPGGPLGGEVENFSSVGTLKVSGTGALKGLQKTINVPLTVQTAVGPRTAGAPVQTFPTEMVRLQGSISGDSVFDFLEITGGSANGFPSPGSTTLTRRADGKFTVDSSFEVGYRIKFIGAPGGPLAGRSGATTGTVNMKAVSQSAPGC